MPIAATPPPRRRNSTGLARDLDVLEVLGLPEATQFGGLGVSRVAELTGRDKTVISRTLATLADAGIVSRDSKRRTYRIGPRLYALASRTQESALAARARPHLRRVARRVGETTHLSILHDGNVLTLVSELSRRELRTSGWEGLTTAAWRTPSGRILLSGWDEQELAAWYAIHGHDAPTLGPGRSEAAPLRFGIPETPPPGSAVVQNLADLSAEISRIRATGYALSDEELELGVVAASAPVTDPTGHIIAALNISAPKSRVAVGLDRLGDYVATSAAQLSTHLGTPPNNPPDAQAQAKPR